MRMRQLKAQELQACRTHAAGIRTFQQKATQSHFAFCNFKIFKLRNFRNFRFRKLFETFVFLLVFFLQRKNLRKTGRTPEFQIPRTKAVSTCVLPPLPIMPPFASACPLALHAAWHVRASAFCVRMPLGAFARARTTTPTTTQAAHTTQAACCAFRISHAHFAFAFACAFHHSSPRSPPRSHTRRSARDFTNHRCAASACFCRPNLTPESTKLAAASRLTSTYAAPPSSSSSSSSQPTRHTATHMPLCCTAFCTAACHTHAHTPASALPCRAHSAVPMHPHCPAAPPDAPPLLCTQHPFGTALHRCCCACLPPTHAHTQHHHTAAALSC
jgi:hypothetical protein